MLNKEKIEKAKEITQNYIKDTPILPYDCLMNIERKSAETLLQYIEQLENKVQAQEMEHKYDVNMIDEVKGEAVKLYKKINKLNKIIDEMAKQLSELTILDIKKAKYITLGDKEEVKQYFEKKVGENNV